MLLFILLRMFTDLQVGEALSEVWLALLIHQSHYHVLRTPVKYYITELTQKIYHLSLHHTIKYPLLTSRYIKFSGH